MNNLGKIISILLALTASLLFSDVGMGLNALLFSMVAIFFLRLNYPEIRMPTLLLIAGPNLGSSLLLLAYPQPLTQFIWIISFGLMWTAAALKLRPLLLFWQSFLSIIQSPFLTIFKRPKNPDPEESVTVKDEVPKFLIYTMIVLIVGLFVLLYGTANPIITDFLSKLEFIEIEWKLFRNAFWYLVLFYGLVVIYPNKGIQRRNQIDLVLHEENFKTKTPEEFLIGKISLWALSGILLLMNLMDLFVLSTQRLPEGISYSQYLHQGFNTLLVSLLLAIVLILYFFRGALNFHESLKQLQTAAKQWIYQNLLLSVVTGIKLFLYINEYGLTYKRIAVLLFLICAVLGLALSFQRLNAPYRNLKILNRMALAAYISAFAFSLIPYDLVISRYNLSYVKEPDLNYLIWLDRPDFKAMYDFTKDPLSPYHQVHDRVYQSMVREQTQYNVKDWRAWTIYGENLSGLELKNPSAS